MLVSGIIWGFLEDTRFISDLFGPYISSSIFSCIFNEEISCGFINLKCHYFPPEGSDIKTGFKYSLAFSSSDLVLSNLQFVYNLDKLLDYL